MSDADNRGWKALSAVLMLVLLLAGLGAGAVALEKPTGQFRGRVLSADDGKPMANARVVLSGPVTRTAVTSKDGTFRLPRMPVGTYAASAKATHYDSQWQSGELVLAEGKVVDGIDFKLSHTTPSLDITNTQRTFLPGVAPKITVRGSQIDVLDVALYRLDFAKIVAREPSFKTFPKLSVDKLVEQGVAHRMAGWRQAITLENLEDSEWFYKPIQTEKLAPGSYYMTVAGDGITDERVPNPGHFEDKFYFHVSDLALVTKRTEKDVLVWGVDLVTHKPKAGAAISLYDEANRLVTGQTDATGVARFRLPKLSSPVIALGTAGGSVALTRSTFYADTNTRPIYAFTDRPVYRPGQTVHYKAIVREDTLGTITKVNHSQATITVKDGQSNQVLQNNVAIGRTSSLNGEFDLAATASLGDYSLEVDVDGQSQSIEFKVSEYKKPEYKVEVTPAKPRYNLGDKATVNFLTSYYFGAPVPKAKMQVTVYAAPLYGGFRTPETDFFSGYTSDQGMEPVWGFGDVVSEQEVISDAEGRATVNVDLPAPTPEAEGWSGDRAITVTVEAVDASGRPVKARKSFAATQGDFRLSLATDESVYTGKQAMRVGMTATNYAEKPVAGQPVDVVIDRMESTKVTDKEGNESWETKRVQAFKGRATTDARGKATLDVPGLGEGSYEVTGTATDAAGRNIRDRGWAWMAGEEGAPSTYRYQALQLEFDKKVYRPGEHAKLLIVSPVAGASVLLAVEGRKLRETRVVQLKGTTALVDWLVTADMKPNVFVSATVVNGLEFIQAERSLNVMPDDRFLQVKVTADRLKLEPGETVTYTVETRDKAGKPAPAEVTLGVVDEAIYAIEPDKTPDIQYFFHGPRYNRVDTTYSFTEDYSGGLDKFAPDPRVRARFEDTAAWFPSIQTGANGKASVKVALPDNLTTWVASAHAADAYTRVGSGRLDIVATKDLLIRLETPRFIVQGDVVTLSAIAHSYHEKPQTADVRLEVEGFELSVPASQQVVLAPGDAKRLTWEVKVPAPAAGRDWATGYKARVIARPRASGGAKPVNGDAMELPVPAMPFGAPVYAAVAGTAREGQVGEVSFEVPQGTVAGTAGLDLTVHAGPLPAIAGAIAYLHTYQYGCTEQTMSRFLPDVALHRRLAAAGVPTAALFPDQAKRMADGLAILQGYQHGDGGWGWWKQDETKLELTSYVLYGLAEAREAKLQGLGDMPKQAIAYLKKELPKIERDRVTRHTIERNAGPDTRSMVLFGLAQWDAAPKSEVDRLWRDRDALTRYGRTQFAWTLARLGDPRAKEALQALIGEVTETEVHASWPADAEKYTWQDNTVECTAYALRTLLKLQPDHPLIAKAVRYLEANNVRGHWVSTKDTASAAIALAESMTGRSQPPASGTAEITLDGRKIGEVTLGNTMTAPAPIHLSAADLPIGKHSIQVALAGSGEVDFAAGLNTMVGAEHLQPEASAGLQLNREYFALPKEAYAKAVGQGNSNWDYDTLVKKLSPLGDTVKSGERILVRVTLIAEKPLRFMAIEDPLPAGCEILDDQPTTWSYWWDHQEFHDEKASFFSEYLSAGTRATYYVMRPTTPGKFRVLPTTAWGMYAPEVRARGADSTLNITE